MRNIFSSPWGLILVGALIGIIGSLLQKMGNPPNMGICTACFLRDIAGAVGLHRAAVVQYIRPEISGFVLGSLIAAMILGEFMPRGGSAPLIRFFLGFCAMIGSLVFLGCTWRLFFHIGGGDLNGIVGLVGMLVGIGIGSIFIKRGFSLGLPKPTPYISAMIMPVLMALLLLLVIFKVSFGEGGAIFTSAKGPGEKSAHLFISLIAGLVIGGLGQRTKICTVGAFRMMFIDKAWPMLLAIVALTIGALVTNLSFKQFNMGIGGMPIAHSNHLWNFLGMVLAGLASCLARGCPGRQLILAGEGDSDATMFILGMVVSAGFAHNWFLAAVPDKIVESELIVQGPGPYGMIAVVVGLLFCVIVGLTAREKVSLKAQ